MKKIISFALMLCLILTFFVPTSSFALDSDYDYYTVLDAETHTGNINGGDSSYAYKEGLTQSYNITTTNVLNPIKNDGSKAFKILRRGTYDPSSINYYDSANMPDMAKNSVGFRAWVAAEPGNEKSVIDKKILAFGFDSWVGETHTIYATADWSNPYLDMLTTEGAWVTFFWNSKKMNKGSNYVGNNRFNYGGGASYNITNEFLQNLKGIYVGFSDANKVGSAYYVDDLQFIYPKGSGYSPELDGVTTDAIKTNDKASIRLGYPMGLRFSTEIDEVKLAEFAGENDYTIGTIIAPKDLVGKHFTHADDHIDVEYKASTFWEGNSFVGSITDIKVNNTARDFVARGYVKIGEDYYYSPSVSVRSIKTIATLLMEDTEEFQSLNETQQSQVSTWASYDN